MDSRSDAALAPFSTAGPQSSWVPKTNIPAGSRGRSLKQTTPKANNTHVY